MGQGLPEWPQYSAATDKLLNFTLDGAKAEVDPWRQRLDAAEPAP